MKFVRNYSTPENQDYWDRLDKAVDAIRDERAAPNFAEVNTKDLEEYMSKDGLRKEIQDLRDKAKELSMKPGSKHYEIMEVVEKTLVLMEKVLTSR